MEFFAHVIVVILVLISSKYINAFKSYGRKCELKSTLLSVAIDFFLVISERVNGFCPSSNSFCHIV
jgi:hypothetical protein